MRWSGLAKWSEICETWINALLQARWSVWHDGNRDRQTIAPLFTRAQNNLKKFNLIKFKKNHSNKNSLNKNKKWRDKENVK